MFDVSFIHTGHTVWHTAMYHELQQGSEKKFCELEHCYYGLQFELHGQHGMGGGLEGVGGAGLTRPIGNLVPGNLALGQDNS